MIDYPDKEERFISEHPKTQLEIVATDYRPVAEIVFSKRSLGNTTVDFEQFIAVKGIKAIGNQLSTDKIKQVNLLESHPYEPPVLDAIEVEEEIVDENNASQPKLF
jgi:topoisomerase-4 subunit A